MTYSKEQLRNIFQNKFDREAWKAIVVNIFGANKVRRENELFTDPDDAEVGYYMGSIDTTDSFRIGLFYYKINSGSVAHKKVGLRNLVKKFINQNWGEFDAAIVVFDDNKDWRLSFVCDIKEEATAPKRFTFVFGEKDNFYRTAIDRFDYLQTHGASFENIRKAFSVDALSDDFFDEYRELYADFVEYITGKRYVKESNKWVERVIDKPNYQYESTFGKDDKLVRDYIKKMFGRIVFLYFLQRKGWLDGNRQYMHDLFYNSDKKDNFLDGVLEPLFFEVLNTDKPYRTKAAKALPGSENIPYLNGGLFARDEIDERTCIFKEEDFERLFDFLDSYNFTIDENDTDDAEIGIDPEMLGRIFENLLEDNKDKGAFYTPKAIVDYMCRESIIAYLQNGIPERSHELIRNFVETFDASLLDEKQQLFIRKKLQAVKICDPAIGSGAFPMGLVNLLSKLYVVMKTDTDTAKMKRHIMEQNIYGVDIEKGAVDIARLRFWLAMIVEEKEPIPLPNLHFKIMQGNSLLESYDGIDLSDLTKLSRQSSLFDSENSEREALISSLKSYYKTSDHSLRDRLFNDIIYNVRRQLLDKNITLPAGKDPSANTDFFLWHTWFSDVFANGGFDIVIGNPPYGANIDNMVDIYKRHYKSIIKNYAEIYKMFFSQGLNLLSPNGVLCYITPNTYLSQPRYKDLRSYLINKRFIQIVDLGMEVFEDAVVPTCISIISNADSFKQFTYINCSNDNNFLGVEDLSKRTIILLDNIKNDPNNNLIKIQSGKGNLTFDDVFFLKDAGIQYHRVNIGLKNKGGNDLYERLFSDDPDHFINSRPVWYGKLINSYYLNPETDEFFNLDYKEILRSNEKVSFTLTAFNKPCKILWRQTADCLRATIDTEGRWFRNTIQCAFLKEEYTDFVNMFYALGVFNSSYIKYKYNEIVRESGRVFPQVKITFLKQLPFVIPSIDVQDTIASYVRLLIERLSRKEDISVLLRTIDIIIYKIFNLEFEEVLSIDPEIPITEEEYNKFK